jgi:hypothetical protein
MRRLVLASLIFGVSACGSAGPTNPDGALIDVHVSDDIGAPVSRMPVRVIAPAVEQLEGSTRSDGTLQIQVVDPGVYQVKVIPREGYLAGMEPLSKIVSVGPDESVVVTFTVHRAGVSTADPLPNECGHIACG